MKKIVLTLTVVLGAALFFSACTQFLKTDRTSLQVDENQQVVPANNQQPTGDRVAQQDQVTQQPSDSPRYVAYSSESLAAATQDGGTAVIFFHASWCPTCKAAERDINSNLSEIPDDVTILKVDYDTATELKKKYGITSQHTYVVVDENGNEIEKWIGGGLNEILDRV